MGMFYLTSDVTKNSILSWNPFTLTLNMFLESPDIVCVSTTKVTIALDFGATLMELKLAQYP